MKKYFQLLLLFVPFISSGQTSRLKYADKLYSNFAYYEAAQGYEDVLERGIDSVSVGSKIAESYQKAGNVVKAVDWYDFLARNQLMNQEEQLQSALLRRQLGDYSGSEKLLDAYAVKYGENDLTKQLLKESERIHQLQTPNDNFNLTEQTINTSASEIGVTYFTDNTVLISSCRKVNGTINQVHSWTGSQYYNLYSAQLDSAGQLSNMTSLKGAVNTKYHDGLASYDTQNGWVYFTRDNYLNGKKGADSNQLMRLKIYRGRFNGAKLHEIEELPFNSDLFSCGHPSVSSDGTILYFSSDMPGGYGGSDIYCVTIDQNGTCSKPINLGEVVNTSQHELFPFYHSTDRVLFISSDGHLGLGGLDVYAVKLTPEGVVKELKNLGAPINSSWDDFSFVNNPAQTQGFIASNRLYGKGSDDIYGFDQKKRITNSPTISGTITDLVTHSNLEDVQLVLKDQQGMVIDRITTDETGNYTVLLEGIDADFTLEIDHPSYVPNQLFVVYSPDQEEYTEHVQLLPKLKYALVGTITDRGNNDPIEGVSVTITDKRTKRTIRTLRSNSTGLFETGTIEGLSYDDVMEYELKFEKAGYLTEVYSLSEKMGVIERIDMNALLSPKLTKVVVGITDLANVIKIEPIYFDYNKSNIRPDAAHELDKIVQVLLDNPSMVIELGSHTDSRGNDAKNLTLSDQRAKSSVDYIVSKGINRLRIKGKGYGETKLLVSDHTINDASTASAKESLHQQNRRTEFIIVNM